MRPKGVKVLTIAFAIPGFLALSYGFSRLLTGEHSGFTIATTFGWGMGGNAEIAMIVTGLAGLIIAFGLWNLKKWAFMLVISLSILNILLGFDLIMDAVKFDALLFGLLQVVAGIVVIVYLAKIKNLVLVKG